MNHYEESRPVEAAIRKRPMAAAIVLAGGSVALLICMVLSVCVGAVDIPAATVWDAIRQFDPDNTQHQVVKELRIPRALAGALVGAGFAVAGAIMQGMTRNPLADSGLLGLNAGAGLALALCFAVAPGIAFNQVIFYCFIGAGIGAGLVFGIGSLAKGGLTPVRLTLAGAAVSALLVALSQGVAILFRVGQELDFWYAGGVAGVQWMQIRVIAPWILGGLLLSLLISRSVTLLSLGDEVAVNLGLRTRRVKVLGIIAVLVLAGASVSAVGVVGFIGLIIPHVARFAVGVDYRLVVPTSAVLGALLVVAADTVSRMVNPPYETPIGALIALIGVPFFLTLVRRGKRGLS